MAWRVPQKDCGEEAYEGINEFFNEKAVRGEHTQLVRLTVDIMVNCTEDLSILQRGFNRLVSISDRSIGYFR